MRHGKAKIEGKKAKDLICIAAIDPGQTTGLAYMVMRESWIEKVKKLDDGLPQSVRLLNQSLRINGWADAVSIDCKDELGGTGHIVAGLGVLQKRFGLQVVVIEDFLGIPVGNKSRFGKRNLLSPVRITAGVEMGLDAVVKYRGVIVKQTASQAKGVVTNERLRAWGFWKGYSDHERDALRHLLLYIRRVLEHGMPENPRS